MLHRGTKFDHQFGTDFSPLNINVRAADSQFAWILQAGIIWQVTDNREAKFTAGRSGEVPWNELSAERIADFLISGSNQGNNRAAEA